MKLNIFITLIICIVLVSTGCKNVEDGMQSTVQEYKAAVITSNIESDYSDIDVLFESKITCPDILPDIIPDEVICTDYTDRGLLRICYTDESGSKLKLQVIKDEYSINYNLKGDGQIEDFPLQFGSGEYTAHIMKNLHNNEYFAVESKTFTVTLYDENDVYLNSIQNIDWNYGMTPIKEVRYIIYNSLVSKEGNSLLSACADDVYQYVIENIQFDRSKAGRLPHTYLPDIEQIYADCKGICYDYTSLLAAMLRSIGIPAKLVTGYSSRYPDAYHAWNEVYIDGTWIILDPTLDAVLGVSSPSEYQKSSDDYRKVYEY